MAVPFAKPFQKVARAKEHILDVEREMNAFLDADPCTLVIEPDPDEPKHEVHKLRLSKSMPDSIADLAADATGKLRSALDNAGYELALLAGVASPTSAYFPFAGSAIDLDNSIKGRSKDIPKDVYPFFRAHKPYRGGNDILWALNRVAITDKHKLLKVALGSQPGDITMEGSWLVGGLPLTPTWDSSKQEFKLATFVAGHAAEYRAEYQVFVAFDEIPIVGGEPVLEVLNQFASIAERILWGIKWEAERLGLVK
jgi:hypothetical protein